MPPESVNDYANLHKLLNEQEATMDAAQLTRRHCVVLGVELANFIRELQHTDVPFGVKVYEHNAEICAELARMRQRFVEVCPPEIGPYGMRYVQIYIGDYVPKDEELSETE